MKKATISQASTDRIDKITDKKLLSQFLKSIFGFNLSKCFISDKTLLYDLMGGESDEYYINIIKEKYGYEIKDIQKEYLVDTITKILELQSKK